MVEVAKAVRALADSRPKESAAILGLEQEAMEAVRFMTHCVVRRAYATVERVEDGDGTARALPLVKVELRFRGPKYAPGRRTLLWKGGPPLEQLLRSMRWPAQHAAPLAAALEPCLGSRLAELEEEMRQHVEALKGDPEAVAAVRQEVRDLLSKERARQEGELRALLKIMARSGWTEDDVLGVWREEQCRAVQES